MKRLVPILVFAVALAAMQLAGGMPLTPLPLLTLAVFALTVFAAGRVRLSGWIFRVPFGSRRARALLLALFVRHFAGILGAESRRALVARRMAVPRAWGRGEARSLAFALAALFQRALTRAERFYAAQWVQGLRP